MLISNVVLSDREIIALKKALDFVMKRHANESMTTNFYPKRSIHIRYLCSNKMSKTLFIYKFEDLSTGEVFYIHVRDYDTMTS